MELFLQHFLKSQISSEELKEKKKKRLNRKKQTQELPRAHSSETEEKG